LLTDVPSANKLELAQANSGLYSGTSILAPPLKPKQPQAPATVGKGWFDIQVLIAAVKYS
jgi:hypothetical protein